MTDGAYVAGLDVGTTKVCTVIARAASDGTLCILGVGLTPSRGLKRGVVVDRLHAIEAVRRSVDEAQRMAGLPVWAAYVGITGDHISSRNVTGRVHTTGGEVTAGDVEKVIQSARDSVSLPPDRQIIHSIVRDFAVDGQRGVKRPVGMAGHTLDVELHVVSGMGSIITNLERCVEGAGISVLERVLEPRATSAAVVTDAERSLGVVLIDIGGGTSDIAAFSDGAICHTSAIPVGGEAVTRDIAQLLNTSIEDAEDLKRRYGCAIPRLLAPDETIRVTRVGTDETDRVPRRLLAEVIEPRMEEIFTLVRQDLRRARLHELVTGGAVLSGGGSQLEGTARVASQVLGDIPVRVGAPRNLSGLAESVRSPIYATGVGLAMLAAQDGAAAASPQRRRRAAATHLLGDWWERIFMTRARRLLGL